MFGENFVIHNDSVLVEQTTSKIEEIAKEAKEKLAINFYVHATRKLKQGELLKDALNNNTIKSPYIIMVVSIEDKRINIFNSSGLDYFFDKDTILDKYTIPLLVRYGNKPNSPSAAILNGYSELVENVADAKGEVMKSTIGSESSVTVDVVRVLVYSTLLFFFYLYIKV
jgi:hypothetical protein